MGNLQSFNWREVCPFGCSLHHPNVIDALAAFCSSLIMELRKDPITRSWVIIGDDVASAPPQAQVCPFCGPSADTAQIVATVPGLNGNAWSARSVVHPNALYHIEGEAGTSR